MGRYNLLPVDTGGTKVSGGMYGIQIATKTAGTYFYVEYRTSSTLGDEALVTWTPISNGGTTGEYGNTVITDCTPFQVKFQGSMHMYCF